MLLFCFIRDFKRVSRRGIWRATLSSISGGPQAAYRSSFIATPSSIAAKISTCTAASRTGMLVSCASRERGFHACSKICRLWKLRWHMTCGDRHVIPELHIQQKWWRMFRKWQRWQNIRCSVSTSMSFNKCEDHSAKSSSAHGRHSILHEHRGAAYPHPSYPHPRVQPAHHGSRRGLHRTTALRHTPRALRCIESDSVPLPFLETAQRLACAIARRAGWITTRPATMWQLDINVEMVRIRLKR